MKPKKKQKKLRITEADFMLANRRAARLEEIAEHGRPVSFRKAVHKSKRSTTGNASSGYWKFNPTFFLLKRILILMETQ